MPLYTFLYSSWMQGYTMDVSPSAAGYRTGRLDVDGMKGWMWLGNLMASL